MIRLLLVDDQPAVRHGLRMLLSSESDLAVVGEAGDGETAIALAITLHPDVVLMDVEMPRTDGIAATRALQEMRPPVPVIFLSIRDDAPTRARAAEAGAVEFIAKSLPADLLLEAIRRVVRLHGNAEAASPL